MSYAWFLIMYVLIGVVFMWFGSVMVRHPERMVNYLVKTAESGQKPKLLIKWLKYFAMVTFVSLVISVLPLNVTGLLYSISCLIIMFVFGRLLAIWDQVSGVIPQKKPSLAALTRRAGIMMLTLSLLSLALWYRHINP